MNEEQYRTLCRACDRVLLAPNPTIERIAIPWLHVVREHPVFLQNYVNLFIPDERLKGVVSQWWQILQNRARWFLQLGRALLSDKQHWHASKELPRRVDVLFVSHLPNASLAGRDADFYFGNMPNEVNTEKHIALVAMINHSGLPAASLAVKWRESSLPRVILSGSLRFLEEVSLHWRLRKESRCLMNIAMKESPGLARRVLVRASEEALSGGSHATLRVAMQISALVAKLRPKTIVVTYEGHAWERLAFAAARSVYPKVHCIGYQHAALFRLQHAIRRSLAHEYNPDQILTAGVTSNTKLKRASDLAGVPISVLGSNRSFRGATMSGGDPTDKEQEEPLGDPSCLVLPEGIASECHLLFEFSLACAQIFPDIQFIWRLHPIVTFESLAAQNSRFRNLPKNVVLSRKTIEEDIACSRWALYRGTTAIIQAVGAGLRPIYVQLSGEMTVDPLYELNGWRVKIETVSEFQGLLNKDINRSFSSLKIEAQTAKNYCEKFYQPFDSNVLIEAIVNSKMVSRYSLQSPSEER